MQEKMRSWCLEGSRFDSRIFEKRTFCKSLRNPSNSHERFKWCRIVASILDFAEIGVFAIISQKIIISSKTPPGVQNALNLNGSRRERVESNLWENSCILVGLIVELGKICDFSKICRFVQKTSVTVLLFLTKKPWAPSGPSAYSQSGPWRAPR